MKEKQRTIVMIYGGRSYEHDVSVITAIQIEEMWRHEDIRLVPLYMRDGDWYVLPQWRLFATYTRPLRGQRCSWRQGGLCVGRRFHPVDCALLLTHGGEGEDGTLQALLRFYGVPYTSCDAVSSAICMNKWLCKQRLLADGFPVVAGRLAGPDDTPSLPCILKPASLGSSIGIGVVHTPDEWQDAYRGAAAYDKTVLCEDYLEGAVEYTCAALATRQGVIVSEVERPLHGGDTYSFAQKYRNECPHQLPAHLPEGLYRRIQDLTRDLYLAWRLKGVVRVDFLWHRDAFFVNEVNTIPGSLAYRLFAAGGLGLDALLSHLVDAASFEPMPAPAYGSLLSDLIGTWK